jgi:hypothetical protein
MPSENSAEILFGKLDSERKTGELQQLSSDFYETIERGMVDPKNNDSINAKKTLDTLKAKRMQKILVYLAYGKPLPSQMPAEEENIYNEIKRIISKEITAPKTTKIKIKAKIPEIVTSSGQKIGPFEEGEIITAEKAKDITFILNNKLGEVVE